MQKPLLAFTMGDPAGIGPEVLAAGLADPRLWELSRPVVVGHVGVMARAADVVQACLSFQQIDDIRRMREPPPNSGAVPVLQAVDDAAADCQPGRISAAAGQAAFDAAVAAARLAVDGHVDGIVTLPLNKSSLHAAGKNYPGHTELLAELCGVREFAMMLYLATGAAAGRIRGAAGLGVIHTTLHQSLLSAIASLSTERILEKIRLADGMFRRLLRIAPCPLHQQPSPNPLPQGEGFARPLPNPLPQGEDFAPRIAVAALNPHAGEQGLMGDEEIRIIAPAVKAARAEGIDATGPHSVDTLFARAADGEFDAVVAMVHDQGHIALKLLGMDDAVNVTLGLPIVRTSVAHGTAFDIAWQGKARHESLIQAAEVAAALVENPKC